MRNLFFTSLLLLVCGVAPAAVVTVDFDGGDGYTRADGMWQENGMRVQRFTDTDSVVYAEPVVPRPSSFSGNSLIAGQYTGVIEQVNLLAGRGFVTRTAEYDEFEGEYYVNNWIYDKSFDLMSLDVCIPQTTGGCFTFENGDYVFADAVGYRVDGSTVSRQLFDTASGRFYFDSDWRDLNRVSVSFYSFGYFPVAMDNIVVNVVPIPAAVWLFASALLGVSSASWLRRKQV